MDTVLPGTRKAQAPKAMVRKARTAELGKITAELFVPSLKNMDLMDDIETSYENH